MRWSSKLRLRASCASVPIGPPVFQMERLFDVLVHKNRKLDALEHAMKEGLPPQAVMRLVANCLSCQPSYSSVYLCFI